MAKSTESSDPHAEVFRASHRYARISARKARLVMDLIRGEPVERALTKLRFCARRAAPMISKVVESAIANATQLAGAESEKLEVYRAYVDEGPTLKRWRPRSMGRAYPRLRRTCHLSVELREGVGTGGARAGERRPAGESTPATEPSGEVSDEK